MKTMKHFFTFLLVVTSVSAFGQSTIDFNQLEGSWTEGKIDTDGNVSRADINRGGWYSLNIHTDTTVVFCNPLECGFGHRRTGKWEINETDTTVTFYFTKKVGYMNAPGTEDIEDIETFKIERLTSDALVLKKNGQEKLMPFIRTEN